MVGVGVSVGTGVLVAVGSGVGASVAVAAGVSVAAGFVSFLVESHAVSTIARTAIIRHASTIRVLWFMLFPLFGLM